jgi:crossover junction endodeoxyribonuclease RuvC
VLILGIDPGSNRCGYGLIRSVGPRLMFVGAGVIDVRKGPIDGRLLEIGGELEDVCAEALAQLGPDETIAAGIESGYIDRHGPSVLVLGAARGAAIYVVRKALACRVLEYAPATVKKATTGSGKADKWMIARMVAKRLGMRREPAPDAADALAIAITRAQDSAT